MRRKGTRDRRIEKTKARLHDALGTLIHQKPYGDIVVKEILGRADVGRSTFYTHFRDKDELLVSGIHNMLRSARPAGAAGSAKPGDVLWFSLPIFAHIESHRRTEGATMGPRGRREMHQILPRAIADLTADGVNRSLRGSHGAAASIPAPVLTHWIASTFVMVLDWWVESESRLPAREGDRLFRRLVEPTLAELFGPHR